MVKLVYPDAVPPSHNVCTMQSRELRVYSITGPGQPKMKLTLSTWPDSISSQ